MLARHIRTHRRLRVRAAHPHRRPTARWKATPAVQRDRPGARHGDARRLRRDAAAARGASHSDAVPARPGRAGRRLAGTARGSARALRARPADPGSDARRANCCRCCAPAPIDGLSIGFRTVKGRIDPRTRVRSLLAVDLWEISIVTFPLLAGARVRAVKQAPSRPALSHARTRAERDWAKETGLAGACGTFGRAGGPAHSAASAPTVSPVRRHNFMRPPARLAAGVSDARRAVDCRDFDRPTLRCKLCASMQPYNGRIAKHPVRRKKERRMKICPRRENQDPADSRCQFPASVS